MKTSWKASLLHSSSFCCCIPVRAGFVLMSIFTFLLSGGISIIIWFEVSHSYQLSTKEHTVFILTGIIETLLFFASAVGFIGAVARKQLFVMIYTYFLYVHFVLNLVVGIYFLVTVRQSNRQQLVNYCSEMFVNTSMEASCSELMSISTYVFIAIVAALLFLELYGTLIATRYVYQLRLWKRVDRSRRLAYLHALSTPETLGMGHSRQASDNIELLRSQESTGDPLYIEDVLDIRPRSYMPVSMHDPLIPSPPQFSLSDAASGHRIRALPPRPDGAPTPPQEKRTEAGRLPNPHARPSLESEEDLVSTNAHAALMDHASYIESRFSPVPHLYSETVV